MVKACDVLIATPNEQQRSGTWPTIRKARAAGKLFYLILPNGGVKRFEARAVELWGVMPYSSESIEFHAATLKLAEMCYLIAGSSKGFEVYREQPTAIEGKSGAA